MALFLLQIANLRRHKAPFKILYQRKRTLR